MTIGITGVVWLARGAEVNSIALNTGPGPAPLLAANAAWTTIAVQMAHASATIEGVITQLGANWQGVAGDAALARLAPFLTWTQNAALHAATTAGHARDAAVTNGAARATMPSLAEITTVKVMKAVALTAAGATVAAGAAAEAAERALDIRAALVMEAYEAASTFAMVKRPVTSPPRLSSAAIVAPVHYVPPVQPVAANTDSPVSPAAAGQQSAPGAAVSPASTGGNTPTFNGSAATGFVNAAQSVAGVISPAASAGGGFDSETGVLGAQNRPASAARTHPAAAGVAFGGGQGGSVGMPGGLTGGARFGADGAATNRVPMPAGWGGQVASGMATGVGAHSDAATAMRPGAPHNAAGQDEESETDRHSPDYLKSFEHFVDGRVVVPSVIGGDQ